MAGRVRSPDPTGNSPVDLRVADLRREGDVAGDERAAAYPLAAKPKRRVLVRQAEEEGADAQTPSEPAADEGQAIADQCRWVAEEPR